MRRSLGFVARSTVPWSSAATLTASPSRTCCDRFGGCSLNPPELARRLQAAIHGSQTSSALAAYGFALLAAAKDGGVATCKVCRDTGPVPHLTRMRGAADAAPRRPARSATGVFCRFTGSLHEGVPGG